MTAGEAHHSEVSGKTKTEAKAKLKEMARELDDGLSIAPNNYTVADDRAASGS
jgi:hypothetical protein